MRKCPDCAEENISESLFCKHCGRCLLTPDPEKIQWSIATHTEHHKTREGIDLYDGHIIKNSRVARLVVRSHQTVPPVIGGWLLLLNILVVIFVAEIVMSLVR
jgi:hypothetical protein